MIEVERNNPVDPKTLSEFFARCGWEEPDAAAKLEWALAASEEWVVCRLDGEMIGFGRSCRLGPVKRIVFDLVVDPRFKKTGLRGEIARLLTESAGLMEEVSFFTQRPGALPGYLPVAGKDAGRSGGGGETEQSRADGDTGTPRLVSAQIYLGKRFATFGGEE
jgi:hypothetical protein